MDYHAMQKPLLIASTITKFSAAEMARLIRRKQLSPVEVVEAHLERIERLNPKINAFACLNIEQARVEARRPKTALMQDVQSNPFLRVPVPLNSSIHLNPLHFQSGTPLHHLSVPPPH